MTDDFFTEFGETLHQAAKDFTAKTDSFFESQKSRNKINSEQRQIDRTLKEIGNIIYEKYVDGELFHEDVAKLCEKVTKHKIMIAKMKEDMAKKKGEKICAACGASLPKEAAFCMKCGAECKVNMPEEEVVENPQPAPEDKRESCMNESREKSEGSEEPEKSEDIDESDEKKENPF